MTYNSYHNQRSGGYKPGGFRPRAGGFDRPQLHDATCAECGNACQVPFRPNGSKPVLCRDCFKKDDGFEPKRFEKHPFNKPFEKRDDSGLDRRLKAIEEKLDAVLQALNA